MQSLKTFDHIDTHILRRKLENMNIPHGLLRWVGSILNKRKECVKIESTTSEWIEIWGTVPQGTLVGVLCFVCMINDRETNCCTIK